MAQEEKEIQLVFTAKCGDLKAIISAMRTIIEEATFTAEARGILFRGMDPSHVALVDVLWNAESFEGYVCAKDTVKFAVYTDHLDKVIKRIDSDETIKISINAHKQMTIQAGTSKTYKLQLIEPSDSDTPLPKINYNATIFLPPNQLKEVISDIDVMADYITMSVMGDKSCKFIGKGDYGKADINLDTLQEGVEIRNETDQEQAATYSLDYLKPIVTSAAPYVKRVSCEFSEQKPLRLAFENTNKWSVHFHLAPRVESS